MTESRWSRCIPSTLATQAFLLVTVIEAAVDISISAIIAARANFLHDLFSTTAASERSSLPVYLTIFAIAHVFQTVLAIDAIYNRNTIQIIGLCVFNFMFLAYAVMQITEVKSAFDGARNPDSTIGILVTIIPIMIGATELIYVVLSWIIYREFGWQIFKSLGADRKVKKMFLTYQVFICICKFDVFFFFSFSLQFVLLVLKQNDIERWLTLAAVPITLVLLTAGFYAARQEIKWLMGVFMGGCLCGFAYFAFKLYRIFEDKDNDYLAVKKSLTVFSGLSLILLLFTLIQSVLVYRNFGAGLKRAVQRQTKDKEEEMVADYESYGSPGLHYKLSSAKSSRMSLD